MDFDIKDYYLRREICPKIVSKSKYESTDPEVKIGWNKLYEYLDARQKLSNYKKEEHLKDIGLEIHDDLLEDLQYEKRKSSLVDSKPLKNLDKQRNFDTGKVKKQKKISPYMKFMHKSVRDAQIWRQQKNLSLHKLSLEGQGEYLKQNIAGECHQWLMEIGSSKQTQVDKDVIMELFKIQTVNPAVSSVNVKLKELKSIPRKVAINARKPEFIKRRLLRKEIENDITKVKKGYPKVAFGKTTPIGLRHKETPKNIKDKWMTSYVYHDELASMETLFKDIVELQSTRSFCSWLLNHPEVPKAKFLEDSGLTDPTVLSVRANSKYQIIDDEDFEPKHVHPSSLESLSVKRPSKIALPSWIWE